MQNTLTFKTTYLEDNFKVLEGENLLFKLYKPSWIGWSGDIKIDNKTYQIDRKGFWFFKIILSDKETKLKIAETKCRVPLLGIYPTAITEFSDGEVFEWRPKGLFNCNWSWLNAKETVVQAEEKNKVFSISGKVNIVAENKHDKFLTALGLYLRNIALGKNWTNLIFLLIYITLLVLRMIYK